MEEDDFFGDGSSADEAPPDNRRGARQVVLQALYGQESGSGSAAEAVGELCARFGLSPPVAEFAAALVRKVSDHAEELDALIAATSQRWSPERIARLDRLVLHMGLAEMLYADDVPVRVAIDEAVELAKTFSTAKSHAFVNGILDAVARRRGLAL